MSKSLSAALLRGAALAITASALLAPAAHAADGPVITGIDTLWVDTLSSGPMTISGSGFTGATRVSVGSFATTGFTVVSDHTIKVTWSPGGGGTDVRVTAGGITSPVTSLAQFSNVGGPPREVGGARVTCSIGATGASFTAGLETEFRGTEWETRIAGTRTPLGAFSAELHVLPRPAGSPDPLAGVENATVTSIDADVHGATQTSLDLTAGRNQAPFPVATTIDGNPVAFRAGGANTSWIDLLPTPGPVSVTLRGYHARVALTSGASSTLDCLPVAGDAARLVSFPSFAPPPTLGSISPTSGPSTGGTVVKLTGSGFSDKTRVLFAGNPATVTLLSDSELEATAPAYSWSGPVTVVASNDVGVVSPALQFTYEPTPTPSPTPAPTPSPTPAPAPVSVNFALKGAATLKTLTKGSVALTGSLTGAFTGGAFTGDLALEPATANLLALGIFPIEAKLAFTPISPTTGTLSAGGSLTTSTKVRVKLPSIRVFGLALAGGGTCQTANPTVLSLKSPAFTAAGGGSLTGTFAISSFTGCGILNGLVSPLTAGNNNAIALTATPAATPAAG